MGALQGLLLRSDQTDSVISELVQKLMYGMSTWESDEVSWGSNLLRKDQGFELCFNLRIKRLS
jgi:hypothetical protein